MSMKDLFSCLYYILVVLALNSCCCIKYSQLFLPDTQYSLISQENMTSPFKKMFLVLQFGLFGSNPDDHII